MGRRLLFVAAFLLLGCVATGPGGKRSLIIVPTRQEVAIGARMAEEVEAAETVLADTAWQTYVAQVGRRIVAVCDRTDIQYHFTVIESDQVNAFAAPGGWIYIYTGLLVRMENEAELAAVLAHEVSHVVARHGIKRLQAAMGVTLAYRLVFGEDASEALEAAVGIGMGLLFAGYSRDAEREADRFGLEYMVRAGYDPEGAVTMFEKLAAMGDAESGNVFEALARSHPETQERIRNARSWVQANRPATADLMVGTERYVRMKARLPAPTAE